MQLLTLGGLRFNVSDFSRPKPLLLLAYLSIEGPKSRRVLADLFFHDTKDPRDSLSTALRHFKPFGDAVLSAETDLVSSSITCDASRLIELLDAGLPQSAVDMYSGPFLAGIDLSLAEELEEWVFVVREHLAVRVQEAHVRLGEGHLGQGHTELANRCAEAALDTEGAPPAHPEVLRRLHALLQTTRSSRLAEVESIAADFGIEVKPDRAEQLAGAVIGAVPEHSPPHNLPTQATSFVGRVSERLEIASLLASADRRLLTVHGPGGMGKSRLAMRVARDQVLDGAFADGVYFIRLESLESADRIPVAVAEAAGIELAGRREPLEELCADLREKRMLLVLDNFEHLAASAHLVSELLECSPGLKVLTTSRQRLDIKEEHVLTLHGLASHEAGARIENAIASDAVQLLVQRAKQTQLDFRLRSDDVAAAVEICELLDRSPLGIELAASWVRMMPLDAIRAEIEGNLAFLESQVRNVPERHQSLRATFDHSWRLLDDRCRKVLPRLAVFRNGFRREAANRVAGATMPVLLKLVNASLIEVSQDGRYRLHSLIRDFSAELLKSDKRELRKTLSAHSDYFRAYGSDLLSKMYTDEEVEALTAIEVDLPNLTDAWTRIMERGNDVREGFPTQLVIFFDRLARYRDGIAFFRDAADRLGHLGVDDPLLIELYANRAWLHYRIGEHDAASDFVKPALSSRATPAKAKMMAHNISGLVQHQFGHGVAAASHFEQAIEMAHARGEPNRAAMYRMNLATTLFHLGDHGQAELNLRRAVDVARQRDYPFMLIMALNNLGVLLEDGGDRSDAWKLYEEALDIAKRYEVKRPRAMLLVNMAEVCLVEGKVPAARRLVGRAEDALVTKSQEGIESMILDIKGLIEFSEGNLEAAEDTLTKALDLALHHVHDMRHLKILVHLAEIWIETNRDRDALDLLRAVAPRTRHFRTLQGRIDVLIDGLETRGSEQGVSPHRDVRIGGMALGDLLSGQTS